MVKRFWSKKEDYNPNIIQTQHASLKSVQINATLRSYYRKRKDLGVITSSFYAVFDRVFSERFGIRPDEIQNTVENNTRMVKSGLNMYLWRNESSISKVGTIQTKSFDSLGANGTTQIATEKHRTRQADNDTLDELNRELSAMLGGFAVRDSLKTVKKSRLRLVRVLFGMRLYGARIIYIQNILLRPSNLEKLKTAIGDSIEQYKPIRESEIKSKFEEIEYDWSTPHSQSYNEHESVCEPFSQHLLQPCFLKSARSAEEKRFEKYLDERDDIIAWWLKNGESKKEHFGVRYEKQTECTRFTPISSCVSRRSHRHL